MAPQSSVCSLHFLWEKMFHIFSIYPWESVHSVSGFLEDTATGKRKFPDLNFVPPIVAPWEATDRYWRIFLGGRMDPRDDHQTERS